MSFVYDMTEPDDYRGLTNTVRNLGHYVAPRGIGTYEMRNVVLTYRDPQLAPPLGVRPKMADAIGYVESMQLIAGVSWLAQLDAASKGAFTKFSTNGMLSGAYGPRLYNQLPRVIELLTREPNTRQAVAVVWREDELANPSPDMPCTVVLSWAIRNGELHMNTHMRSNDVWLGLPYDVWMFTSLQAAMSHALMTPVGTYTHSADSLHLYASNVDDVTAMNDTPSIKRFRALNPFDMSAEVTRPVDRWLLIQRQAEELILEPEKVKDPSMIGELLAGLGIDSDAYDFCDDCRYAIEFNHACAC